MNLTENMQLGGEMIVASAASAGLARGRAVLCGCAHSAAVPRRRIDANEAPRELERFDEAVDAVEMDLTRVHDDVRRTIGQAEAEIFGMQAILVREAKLRKAVSDLCVGELMNVEAAVEQAIQRLVAVFARMKTPYLRERGIDLQEVGRRLLDHLACDEPFRAPSDAEDCILVTCELFSSAVAQLESRGVRGLIIERGGLTTHASILARALGIPMLVQATDATRRIAAGDPVMLDALAGRAFINPTQDILRRYDQLEADLHAHQNVLEEQIDLPVVTLDGIEIELAANIGQTADAVAAARVKAAGAGLYRTEFVFMVQDRFPSEEEQYRFYQATAGLLAPGRTVIRLLDAGSDKPLGYFPLPQEANPALGCRGVRLLIMHPAVLRVQLRAILRLSATHPVSILLPMIGGVDELRTIKKVIKEEKSELAAAGLSFNPDIPVGVMVETPAAVFLAAELTAEVDFFSVGTNDLVQYLLAADRDGATSAYDPLHPAVLRALASLVETTAAAGKPISLCGEIAGDPLFTALLLGLGFRRFSVTPGRLLEIKHAIRAIDLTAAGKLAERVLRMVTTRDIRSQVEHEWNNRRPVAPPEFSLTEPSTS